MRIKKVGKHRQEILYVGLAAILAMGLISYLFFLVHSLSTKAQVVFGNDVFNRPDTQTFNFKQYDALMKQLYPNDPTVLSTYGTQPAQQPVAAPPIISATGTVASSSAQ